MFKTKGFILKTALYNFRLWKGNVRVTATFLFAFILCFLLTAKSVDFAVEHETTLQIAEVFLWTFGDSNSILLSSLLLLLLYSDMPFITLATPFFLVRGNRVKWIMGQMFYICTSTIVYLFFILLSTCILCMRMSYIANIWSKTAAILAYSDEGKLLNLPSTVKMIEMDRPYQTLIYVFLLMVLYTLVMAFVMLLFNLWKGTLAGIVGVLCFSVYGVLLNPDNIQKIFNIPDVLFYKARVWVGWLSPLNHATYSMHNFGYDNLPTLFQTCCIFIGIFTFLISLTIYKMKGYGFQFKGTEK